MKIKGIFFLILSAAIGSAGPSTISKLIELGNSHLINGKNPVSFCNVLFLGSFMALIALIFLYHKEIKSYPYDNISKQGWCAIISTAIISGVIIPSLYFFGIKYGNVINVILISTIETPLIIFSGWFFLQEKPNKLRLIASFFTTSGVLLLILLPYFMTTNVTESEQLKQAFSQGSKPLFPYFGEVLIFIAVLLKTVSMVIILRSIKTLPESVFNVLSMLFGLLFFFGAVTIIFGTSHFEELFSTFLWKWMLVYGGVIIALSIYLKYVGLKYSDTSEIAISRSSAALWGMFFSYLILGTNPNISQLIGAIFVFLGIFLALYSKLSEAAFIMPKQGPSGA